MLLKLFLHLKSPKKIIVSIKAWQTHFLIYRTLHSLRIYYSKYSSKFSKFHAFPFVSNTFCNETYFCAQLFSQKFLAYATHAHKWQNLHTHGFVQKFHVHEVPG